MFSERHPLGNKPDRGPQGFTPLELAKAHLLIAFDLIREAQGSQPFPPSDLFSQLLTATNAALDLLVALLYTARREFFSPNATTKKPS